MWLTHCTSFREEKTEPQSIKKKWQRWSDLQVQGFVQHRPAATLPTRDQSGTGGRELASSEKDGRVTIYSTNSYEAPTMCQA